VRSFSRGAVAAAVAAVVIASSLAAGWVPVPASAGGVAVAFSVSSAEPAGADWAGPPATASPGPVPSAPATVEVAPPFVPAAGEALLGPVPAATPARVAVGLPSMDPDGLAAFVATASVPGTPEYRQFLSAATADARYGASPQELRSAEAYFEGFGLSATAHSDGLLLLVSGPAGGLDRAFGTTLDEYGSSSGSAFVSHATAASLPSSLAATGVFGLGDATPLTPALSPVDGAVLGPDASCGPSPGGLAPCEVQTAYNESGLLANGTDGAGTRIGIVDAYSGEENQSQLAADLGTFASASGLSAGTVDYEYPVPTAEDLNSSTTNPDWDLEDALDLEWARAAAPGAAIAMTFSPDAEAGLYDAVDALVANDSVNVLSMSWGEPDVGVYDAYLTPCSTACNASSDGSYAILGPVLELGAAEGISVFAASGDCGAADGTSGVSTNFPASDPYVTGVGGTVLSVGSGGVYASESAWSGNATGATAPGCDNQGGSGGGYAPFPEPWWQVGIPDPTGARGVPDVALNAGTAVGIVVDGAFTSVGGTSAGTPAWAGFAALADQLAGGDLGLLDPSLYQILASGGYAQDFHAITEGNNGAYSAAAGWNPVTGLGTPILTALLPALLRGGGLPGGSLSTFVYASPRYGAAPQNVSIAVATTGGTAPYPLEGVSFGDGTSAAVTGGLVNHSYASPGVYLVQSYAFDASGNATVAPPVVVDVGGHALTVNLTASVSDPGVGEAVTFAATASGGSGPYRFQFFFGDGAFSPLGPDAGTAHVYAVAGGFCAEVVANDSSVPSNAAASARVAIAVGGAPTPSCGNPASPLTLSPIPAALVRDAPADLLAPPFAASGGATAPDGLAPSVVLRSNESYSEACGCAIFPSPGNFSVSEWYNDSVGDQAFATANLTIVPGMDATFATSNMSGPAPLTVYFFAKVKGGYGANASDTVWTFGTGNGAVGHTVEYVYENPGEFVATGLLEDSGGGNASEAFVIDVEPPGSSGARGVSFTVSPATNVLAGEPVTFTASPVGIPTSEAPADVNWSLDAGQTAWGDTVTTTYAGPLPPALDNTLTIGASVTDPYFVPLVNATARLPNFFALGPGGAVPATSDLALAGAVSPDHGIVPFPIFGNATFGGLRPVNVEWSFGDGTESGGLSFEHVYYGPAGYTVSLTASDSFGNRIVRVFGVAAGPVLGIAGGPDPGSGARPLTVVIHAEAYGGKGPPYTYLWTFPNGSRSTSTNGTLYFPDVGDYRLSLNVTDRSGAQAERIWTIVVQYPYPDLPLETILGGAGIGALLALAPRLVGWIQKPREKLIVDGKSKW